MQSVRRYTKNSIRPKVITQDRRTNTLKSPGIAMRDCASSAYCAFFARRTRQPPREHTEKLRGTTYDLGSKKCFIKKPPLYCPPEPCNTIWCWSQYDHFVICYIFIKGVVIIKYQRLTDLREDADLKQETVAKILGTSQTQYSRWERGEREIPFHHIITLALFYNVSIDYIAGIQQGLPYGNSKTKRGKGRNYADN